jgi:hypothetical protein
MGNLATIKVFTPILLAQKNYLLISDEYFRIKICKFPEIYDIVSIWIPFQGIVTSIINFKQSLLLLFEFEKNNPQIHCITEENIENEQFNSILIDSVILEGDRNQIFLISHEKESFGSLEQWENFFSLKIWSKTSGDKNENHQKPLWELRREFKGEHKGKMKVRYADENEIIVQEIVAVAEDHKKDEKKTFEGFVTFEISGLKIFYFKI